MKLWVSASIEVSDLSRLNAAKNAMSLLVGETIKEIGCIRFEIHQHLEMPQTFTLWEIWQDEASLAHHFEMPHTKQYLAHGFTTVNYIEKMVGLAGPKP